MVAEALGALPGAATFEQLFLWGVLQQLMAAPMAPLVQAITNTVNSVNQEVPLSPADLALAVIRNILSESDAADLAKMSGTSPDNFHTLALLTGDAPGPQELAVALRRKIITPEQYDTGIRQGRLRDEWASTIRQLAVIQPSPVDMLQAVLEGQVSVEQGKALYEQLGGDPQFFQIEYDTRGSSPSPVELGRMVHRGIIPATGTGPTVTSYEQGFLEGPWRNKWSAAMLAISDYLPPPRTVTALVRESAVAHDQALELFKEAGLSDQLAQAYLASASMAKVAAAKELSVSVVHSLYTDRLISAAEATAKLATDGYDGSEAAYILSVWDLEWQQRAMRAAATRIGTLYVGHKITDAVARAELGNIGVPPKNVEELVTIWAFEREANVRQLTEAQIVEAWEYGILSQSEAAGELQAIGYTAQDAGTLLAIKNKGPLTPPAPVTG